MKVTTGKNNKQITIRVYLLRIYYLSEHLVYYHLICEVKEMIKNNTIKVITLVLLVIFITLYSTIAEDQRFSGYVSGNDLVERMKEYEKPQDDQSKIYFSSGFYMGYVTGVHDALTNSFGDRMNVTGDQMCAKVAKYLKEHPETWHCLAASIIDVALKETFPKE